MKVGLVQKLMSVLNKVLEKLGRYDEGTMMGGFLGMMVSKYKVIFPLNINNKSSYENYRTEYETELP